MKLKKLNSLTKIFIFARKNSKGIKNKNLYKINGKPLIFYTLKTALNLTKKKNIFLSSDGKKYKKIADDFGVNFIQRPKNLATSVSPELLSWKHAINFLKEKKIKIKTFVSLPVTSPLRSKSDVLKSISKLKGNTDIVLTASESNRNPYFNIVEEKKGSQYYKVVKDKTKIYRRQDAPQTFDLNTVAFVSSPKYIEDVKSIFDGNVAISVIPNEISIDIDNMFDMKLALLLLKK